MELYALSISSPSEKLWETSINKRDKYRTNLVGGKWVEFSTTALRFIVILLTPLKYPRNFQKTDLKAIAFENIINFQIYEAMLYECGCISNPHY